MKKEDKPLGLYIHIPFCKSKCAYCDFYSLPNAEKQMNRYTAALRAHLAETAPCAAAYLADTVYFGGGTPSYLGVRRLKKLLKTVRKRYRLSPGAEITLEANPKVWGTGARSAPCGKRVSTVSLWGCSRPTTRSCGSWAGPTPLPRRWTPWARCGGQASGTCPWT